MALEMPPSWDRPRHPCFPGAALAPHISSGLGSLMCGLSAFDPPQVLHVHGAHSAIPEFPSWLPTSCACSSLHLHLPHLPKAHPPFLPTLHLYNLQPLIRCLSTSLELLFHPQNPRSQGEVLLTPSACPRLSCPAPGTAISDGWRDTRGQGPGWVAKSGSPKPQRPLGPPVRSPAHHTGPASSLEPRGAPLPPGGRSMSGPAH